MEIIVNSLKAVVKCRRCGEREYRGCLHWRDGVMMCRKCIYEVWQNETKKRCLQPWKPSDKDYVFPLYLDGKNYQKEILELPISRGDLVEIVAPCVMAKECKGKVFIVRSTVWTMADDRSVQNAVLIEDRDAAPGRWEELIVPVQYLQKIEEEA